GRHVHHAAAGAPIPVPARMDALLPEGAAGLSRTGGDDLRSVRPMELQAPNRYGGGRAARATAPLRLGDPPVPRSRSEAGPRSGPDACAAGRAGSSDGTARGRAPR